MCLVVENLMPGGFFWQDRKLKYAFFHERCLLFTLLNDTGFGHNMSKNFTSIKNNFTP